MSITISALPKHMQTKVSVIDGCWVWGGARNNKGYGVVTNGRGGSMLAHRKAYEAIRGEIPAGFEIDHLCENEPCVNPDHLEAVTPEEHRRRIGHDGLHPVYAEPRGPHEPSPEVSRALGDFFARIDDYRRRYEGMSADEQREEDAQRHRLHLITGTRCACEGVPA